MINIPPTLLLLLLLLLDYIVITTYINLMMTMSFIMIKMIMMMSDNDKNKLFGHHDTTVCVDVWGSARQYFSLMSQSQEMSQKKVTFLIQQ